MLTRSALHSDPRDQALELGRIALSGGQLSPEHIGQSANLAQNAIRVHIASSSDRYSRLLAMCQLASQLPSEITLPIRPNTDPQQHLFPEIFEPSPLTNDSKAMHRALDALDTPWLELFGKTARQAVSQRKPQVLLDKFQSHDWNKLIDAIVEPAKKTQKFIEAVLSQSSEQATQAISLITKGIQPERKEKVIAPVVNLYQVLESFDSAVRQNSTLSQMPPPILESDELAETSDIEELDRRDRNREHEELAATANNLHYKINISMNDLKRFMNNFKSNILDRETIQKAQEAVTELSHMVPAYFIRTIDIWHKYAGKSFQQLGDWLEDITTRTT